ncbi:hypothetical protein TruAng_009345 [Truncatella angustata]|nr:hypothetical protein TruAng_009345 [Truncatella angustata]
MQQTPAIPPRPSRSTENDNSSSAPSVPPRPTRRFNRSVSPNPDRFAPSPLNEPAFNPKSPGRRTSNNTLNVESIDRPGSVSIPSIGQEGQEYAAFDDVHSSPENHQAVSPEQTRTVGEDIKLHAPKPKLAQEAAVQRVAAVTRTDSDRAAEFGIGRPSSEDPYPRTLKKKASTTSQLSHISHDEDEHGIPEIGQRVPLLGHAGDAQAPTPAPGASATPEIGRPGSRHHTRRTSGRSQFGHLPSDSYGLHGHGVENNDKLEKAYYEKHPEAKKFDLYNHHLRDRVKDYSMSSEDLNKLVRDSDGAGFGTNREFVSTPSEQVGFEATDYYVSRNASPRPPSAASKRLSQSYADSPLKTATGPDISVSAADGDEEEDDNVIHVDEPGRRKGFAKYGNAEQVTQDGTESDYEAPILAADEMAKRRSLYDTPAVEPQPERRGSSYEMEQPKSRPHSRAASVYDPPVRSVPLDDVEEYEPLFPEDENSQKKAAEKAEKRKSAQRFPSRDIWEDAPDSVHGTAEVSTPEPTEGFKRPDAADISDIVPREGETIAQAFARRQEELAEAEDRNPDSFMRTQNSRSGSRPRSWVEAQPHLAKEMNQPSKPASRRFPSRDVWEDTPDSLRLETTVSTPQSEKDPQSADAEESPVEKSEKPAIPVRPAKKLSGDDKPTIPDRPKPQIPARAGKPATTESREPEAAPKQKPAVPARPVGGKIAALQAGFMSDLNKRLQLGPQAPKKEEPKEEEIAEEKEKAPLSDARKGRARGPQRRAPTKSSSPGGAAPPASNGKPVLSFSMTRTLWCIDEEGTMNVQEEQEPSEAKPELDEEPTQSREPQLEESRELIETEQSPSKPIESTETPSTTIDTNTNAETKTLATNTAGGSILQETLDKKPEGDHVVDVEDVKDQGLDS